MAVVKQVNASGQISLGKEFAGSTVLVQSPESGVWVIKTATTIPDSERWLHALQQPGDASDVDRVAESLNATHLESTGSVEVSL